MAEREKYTTDKQITIVIGTLNRPAVVKKLLEQLIIESVRHTLEVFVFDQSTPENFQLLQKIFPHHNDFNLIHLEQPNTCKYLNLGWQKATAPIVLYLDDDVTITEQTVQSHLAAYSNPQINGVAGRVINDGEAISQKPNVGKIDWAGAVIEKNFSYNKKSITDFPYGCNMSFRRSILEQINGFDENLTPPVYAYNEVDLGYRISKRWKNSLSFVPEALVYHHRFPAGGTRNNPAKQIASSNNFNYGYFLGKNFTFLENILCLARRFFYQITRELQGFLPILKGLLFAKLKNRSGKHLITQLLLITVFAVLLFLRFWKTPEFFSFNFDEEYQANLAWEQVKDFHPIWIGVSASNVNYYLGPGITYLNAALFWLSKGDPAILGNFAFLVGLATIISVYFVTKEFFGQKTAVFSTLFYAGSSLMNFYDRRFWNPMPIPFITVWLFYGLMKARTQPSLFILVAFLMGLVFHVHLSLLIFIPLVLFYLIKYGKKISLKIWLGMTVVYIITTFPLIIYDINHNYDNILFPLRFIQKSADPEHVITTSDLISHLRSLFHVFERIWFVGLTTNLQREFGLGPHGPTLNNYWLLTLTTILVLLSLFMKAVVKQKYRLLSVIYIFFLLAYIFYPGGTVEYFILGFIALFSIAAGIFIASLPNKLSYIFIGIFLMANMLAIITMNQEPYGLLTRKRLIQRLLPQINNQSFFLETVGRDKRAYHPYGGWRHLFRVYGKTPTQSTADKEFGWIYPDELTDTEPQLRVIISEDIPYNPPTKPLFTTTEGAFNAYIINNP